MIEIYAEVGLINKVKKEGDEALWIDFTWPKWRPLRAHYHAAQFAKAHCTGGPLKDSNLFSKNKNWVFLFKNTFE